MTSREELRKAELELMRQRERVAEMRRGLPPGDPVDDYVFVDVESGNEVRLSELFTHPSNTLILYHFMFGKKQTDACPMCTMWIDGYNGIAHHVRQRADFVVLAAAPIGDLQNWAKVRGWDNLRLVSASDSTFKRDLGSEAADGEQIEMVSVFKKQPDGTIAHIYSSGAELGPGQRERGIDLLSPVWNLFDLTPEGRGDWYPNFEYERGV